MQETQVQSLGQEDLLEKEMAPHSSILAWKIPWMEEPGRLQSMVLQRVGHDWATSLSLYSFLSILKGTQISLILYRTLPDFYLPPTTIILSLLPFKAKIYVPSTHLHYLTILCFLLIPADATHLHMTQWTFPQSVWLTYAKVDTEYSLLFKMFSWLPCCLGYFSASFSMAVPPYRC